MPHWIYLILHVVSAFAIFLSYGLLIARAHLAPDNTGLRKFGTIVSGIALVLLLVSGFGLVAKMQYGYVEGWLLVKYLCWLALGALPVLINRQPAKWKLWTGLSLGIGLLAATLGAGHLFF